MYRFIIPTALLLVGSAALSADSYRARQEARDAAALAKALDGLTPGKATSCINPHLINETERIGDKILYKTSRREIWVNDTGGGCYGLSRGDAIVTRSYNGDLCRGDIIHTVDLPAHMPSGSCTFGDFVPYRK